MTIQYSLKIGIKCILTYIFMLQRNFDNKTNLKSIGETYQMISHNFHFRLRSEGSEKKKNSIYRKLHH